MSALIQALVQDIRTDVLMALDPRVMTKKEATALILLTGWIAGWHPMVTWTTSGCFHCCLGLTPISSYQQIFHQCLC
jgi:hypothetical protein